MAVSSRRNHTSEYLYNLKVGDMVTVKSEDWYHRVNPENNFAVDVQDEEHKYRATTFNEKMAEFLGTRRKILRVLEGDRYMNTSCRYILEGCTRPYGNPNNIDPSEYWIWSPEMLEL